MRSKPRFPHYFTSIILIVIIPGETGPGEHNVVYFFEWIARFGFPPVSHPGIPSFEFIENPPPNRPEISLQSLGSPGNLSRAWFLT